jgi:type I restriction enzyme S subunit
MAESNLLSLSYGRIVRKDINDNDGLLPESFETYQVVEPNDVVWRLTDLQNDKRSLRTAIADERGIITSAYLATAPFAVEPRFFAYLVRAYDLQKVFYSMGGGLRQSMKFADVKRLPILVPPPPEQARVVAFLDRETAKIDVLVDEQRRLIELLKEKRQAVISHAVTQGLDPSAPMKASGVEWLGEVPAHWCIRRIGQVAAEIQTGPFGSQLGTGDYVDDGVPVINPAHLRDGRIEPDSRVTVTDAFASTLGQHKLKLGDIVLGRRGEMGRCAVVGPTEVGWLCGTGCLRLSLDDTANPHFVASVLRSRRVAESLKLASVGSTMDNLNASIVSRVAFAMPSQEEQASIVAAARELAAQFDSLLTEATAATALLGERRAALISAAVTGRIDVRVPAAAPAELEPA